MTLRAAAFLALALVPSLGAAAGCAHARPPGRALDAWAAAVERGDRGAAWRAMSSRYRETHPRAALDAALGSGGAAAEAARRVRRRGRAAFELPLPVGDGDLRLVHTADGWRIAGDVLPTYPQETPAEALRAFVLALERRRWDVLVRLAPERWGAELDPERLRRRWESDPRAPDRVASTLRPLLELAPDQSGDEARFGDGAVELRLVREGGRWRVLRPEP